MSEVSCQAFSPFFDALKRRGLLPSALVEGTPVSLARLSKKNERFTWDEYRSVMANVREIWSPLELVEIGQSIFRAPLFRYMAVLGRLLFTPRDFYRWITAQDKGGGVQTFTTILSSFEDLGEGRLRIVLSMKPGYVPCQEFFLITQGSFIELPRIVGLGSAKVDMTVFGDGARYDIEYPLGGGTLAWLRKAITWPFTARAAARELKDAHDVLLERYGELEQARAILDRQARQLRTAHRISTLVHADLDLDRTLKAVVEALIEAGGFDAAEVAIATDVEGSRVIRTVHHGSRDESHVRVSRQLTTRGREIGELTLWLQNGVEAVEYDELLTYVVPTVAMAVDDALTFTAVDDYRANLERRVEARTAELGLANERLAQSVEELERARTTRERIFANINHEIRTPLSMITMAVSTIQRRHGEKIGAQVMRSLEAIQDSVGRLLHLIDGLLLLAAGTEGKLKLRRSTHDVAGLVQRLVSTWTVAAEEASLTLSYDGPDEAKVYCDEAALERVVTNLMSNAIKFTPNGGSIAVELRDRADEQKLEIAVRDTGIGLDDDFRERVFERFEQGRPPVRAATGGSGIGLSIVKELINAHGGTVRLESNRGGGSVFAVAIPSTQEGPEDDTLADGSVVTRRAPTDGMPRFTADVCDVIESNGGGASATILVAEDEPELRRAIVECLAEHYRVVAAADGLAALDLAKKHQPDLLLTDLSMPGMDGVELTRRFREVSANRLAPVVFLTAFGDLRERLAGLDAGAVDYLVKPVEPAELLARIESQLKLRDLALRLNDTDRLASLAILSAGLAHEIRNPANVLVNAIEPLRHQLPRELTEGDSAAAKLLDALEDSANQVGALSRDLLGLARADEPTYAEERVDALLERTLSIMGPTLGSATVRTKLEYAGEVRCSRALMIQVLANLLENSMHAAGEGGWIEIRSYRGVDAVGIEISDSGPGVPPEMRERIFDPFFTTKPAGVGTGLGLPTARRIVERHNGSLRIVGRDEGSVFRVTLPLGHA